jgi:hypothetical protein
VPVPPLSQRVNALEHKVTVLTWTVAILGLSLLGLQIILMFILMFILT